jgi:hypothetical protein
MSAEFTGVMLKLKRAKEHFNAIAELIDRYKGSHSYGTTSETNAKHTEHVWKARVASQPPLRCAVLTGEFLFNLRSCLDNLAWALAATVGDPPRGTEFPIFSSQQAWEVRRADGEMVGPYKVRGLPAGAKTVIEELQPFKRKERLEPVSPQRVHIIGGEEVHFPGYEMLLPEEPYVNPLWHLHHLNNVDKHRFIHVAVVQPVTFVFPGLSPELAEGVTTEPIFGTTEDGAVVLRITGTRPLQDVDMYAQPFLTVAIPETDATGAIVVPEGLLEILTRVEEVVGQLT